MTFQPARSEEQWEIRRRTILDTAAAVLGAMPVSEVTISELSRRAGICPNSATTARGGFGHDPVGHWCALEHTQPLPVCSPPTRPTSLWRRCAWTSPDSRQRPAEFTRLTAPDDAAMVAQAVALEEALATLITGTLTRTGALPGR
jgi:hypothetical protein